MLYLVLAVLSLFWLYMDGHTILYTQIKNKIASARRLNTIMKGRYSTVGAIICITLKTVTKLYWLKLIQWLNNTVQIIGKNQIQISYIYKGRLYRVVTNVQRGPSEIVLAMNENEQDITNKVVSYLGPNNDWHLNTFTPRSLKCENISLYKSDGSVLYFDHNENLDLNKHTDEKEEDDEKKNIN